MNLFLCVFDAILCIFDAILVFEEFGKPLSLAFNWVSNCFKIKFTFTSFSRYFECFFFFLNFVYSVIIMPTASKFAFGNNNYNIIFFYINTEYSIKYIIR